MSEIIKFEAPRIISERNFEFEYVQRSSSYTAYFNDVTDVNNYTLASVETRNHLKEARWINYKLFGATPTANIIQDNSIKYENVFENVDLEYIAGERILKETITLKAPIESPQFTFTIKTDTAVTMEERDGRLFFVEVVNGIKEDIWFIDKPFAMDSNNVRTDNVAYILGTANYNGVDYTSISIAINDADFLSTAVYPVIIDPTTYIVAAQGNRYSFGGKQLVRMSATQLFAAVETSSYYCAIYRSDDNGGSWTFEYNFNYDTRTEGSMCRDASGNLWVVVPYNKNLRWAKRTPAGVWTNGSVFSTDRVYNTISPAIFSGPNNYLHIVYSIGDGAVWYVRSADGGSTWELPWKVIPSDADSYDDITLGITSDNKVCVVARAVSSGNYNIIYYAWSSDGGSSWGTVSSASPQDWDLAESHWEMYPNPSDTTKLKLFTTSNPNLSQIYELDFAYGSAPTLAATYNLKDIFADSKNIQKISLSYKSGYWYVLVYTLTTSSYKIIALCKMSSGVITLLETYVNQTSGIPGVEMAYQPYNGIQVAQIDGYYRLDSANYIYLKFLWSHKLMGLSTPSKIMGATPTKVMGIQ